jgi:asparagine N-glycosylation enzyme membrane subunit Stt3
MENIEKKNKFETFFTKHKIFFIVLLVFILAFAVRGHLLKYDYMFEFDTYWHLRMTGYTLQGDLPEYDSLGFYQQGGSNIENKPKLLWYLTSFLYILFTLGAPYKKELLMQFARFLPAIFGAIIAVAMYFLGKEIYNKKVGIIMALVTATIPAFVYRTMAGFYEDDALGFLWLILGFLFLVKALKNLKVTKTSLKLALISGVFFGLMAFTWAAFLMIPLILIPYFIAVMFYMAYKNYTNKQMASFLKIFVIAFILFIALASIAQPVWIKKTTNFVNDYIPLSKENVDRLYNKNLDESDVLAVSVGEENVGKKFFLYKYSFLIWIPFLIILLIPLYLFFSKRRDIFMLLIFFFVLLTGYMAWSKLKFTFYFGIPIAAATGVLFFILDEWIKNKSLVYKRFFAIFIGLIVLTSIAAGTHEVFTKVPHIVEKNDWRESIFWISENTSSDAKIFNWWDYGHWITYFTERKASTDNTNSRMEGNSDFGKFILTDDFNFTKEIMKKYDSDYFIADTTYFNRYTSFGSYGFMTINYQDPRISRHLSVAFDCAKGLLPDNTVAYKCNENIFKEEDMEKLPTTWVDNPTDIINGNPVFIYRLEDNSKVIFLNTASNQSTFAKIWFSEENHSKLFSKVYENGDVRIYKIEKDFLN